MKEKLCGGNTLLKIKDINISNSFELVQNCGEDQPAKLADYESQSFSFQLLYSLFLFHKSKAIGFHNIWIKYFNKKSIRQWKLK